MCFGLILLSLLLTLQASAVVISVTRVSNLVIGKVIQGDSARVIPAGTAETAANASFRVRGDANRAYSIVLPTTAALKRTGATNMTLSNFQSYPAEGANGVLNASGTQMLYVGATLNAIPLTQKAGAYTGTFSINVVY